MLYCIFRKSDKENLYNSFTEEEDKSAWISCLTNEGGVADDYIRVVSTENLSINKVASLDVNNKIIIIDNPKITEKNEKRQNARNKLKGLLPGFTDQDINDLLS